MNEELDQQTIDTAVDGDEAALERIVLEIQDPIYNLSIRMLGRPDDAADATQEILIRVVTRLSTFRGQSRFSTWVYRIASNYLIDMRRAKPHQDLSFDEMAERLDQPPNAIRETHLQEDDAAALEREVFLGCSLAMLRCLDREHRLVFILSAVLGLDSVEGAEALEITRAAFRKRLSRARKRLRDFLVPRCSLLEPNAGCRCEHQVNLNVRDGLVRPGRLALAAHPCIDTKMTSCDRREAKAGVEELSSLADELHTLRALPQFAAPDRLVPAVVQLLETAPHRILN